MEIERDRIRVLVVDDHAVVRRGLLAFLDGELTIRSTPRNGTTVRVEVPAKDTAVTNGN
jgi:DNA-binding NarL/FixJ family response regulator